MTMRKRVAAAMMAASMWMGQGTAVAQDKKPLSRPLAIVGVFTMITGGALMIPWPEDFHAENWELFGKDVCVINDEVGNRFDIYDGRCRNWDPLMKAGLITLAAGAAMTIIGLHQVTVAPTVSPTVVGATVTYKW